ncbi:sensor histidine kinase [Actinoallomurus rhizosphaericola]|uniref:sensor histidine kinase n=1 Tax=Actinoallomurus rhizosphaericola TaxID=2952536 RepID=UPI0020927C2E|nr:sensor histidine kinase [Actinoallomurus rhizosphaericola]MCO5999355.1 sensor histidine kinase [Actinoallomurus rhizosphaericola]
MSAVPPSPLLKRVPPGAWTALAWCAGTVFTFLIRMRLPGESMSSAYPGVLFHRWDGRTTLALATALTLIGSGLLRRRPLAALILVLAGAVLGTVPLSVGAIPLPQFLSVDVALYFIAATRRRGVCFTAVGLVFATLTAYVAVRLANDWTIGTSTELAVAMTALVAWLIGNSTHQAREHAEAARARTAAEAVTAERLRIARELHDMVAHSIGIVALQAGAARRVIDTQPTGARDALREVEMASRETLSGLRRMLGALRQAELKDGARVAVLDEMPGLADVDRLAETITSAGVRVEVRWRGERRPLPPQVDLSAFRIIQEAVTNVVRHSGARSCVVSIERRDEEVAIEVVDDGRGHGVTSGTGYGLVGMRERVALLHGELTTGPRPEGGFRVTARLPLPTGVR